MTLKMSKNDKALFYYLGLTLLVLIVLGAVFGISSVKESFGRDKYGRPGKWHMIKKCIGGGRSKDECKQKFKYYPY